LLPCTLCATYIYANGERSNAEIPKIGDAIYQGRIVGQLIEFEWVKNDYEVCEFVVTLGGTELARLAKCSEQQCKSPSGSVVLENGDVLEWSTYLKPRRKARPQNAPCVDAPCPDCKCLCERVCILWRRDDGYGTNLACTGYGCLSDCNSVLIEAELDEDCITGDVIWGPVVFEPDCPTTPVGTVSIYVILREGDYGCELALFVNGEERAVSSIPGLVAEEVCKDIKIGGSYEDEDGCIVTVTVECKKCGDPCFSAGDTCNKGCCFTDIECLGANIDYIPFVINGGPWNGTKSYFHRATPTGEGACGTCGFLEAKLSFTLFGALCNTSGAPTITPCSRTYYFAIMCEDGFIGDADIYGDGDEECGNRARFIVGSDGLFLPDSDFDNSPFQANPFGVLHNVSPPFAIADVSVNCSTEGMQGTIDLGQIIPKLCPPAYSPPCPGLLSEDCCELNPGQTFEGVTLTLLPYSELEL